MNTNVDSINNDLLSCDICIKEIPVGDTKLSEVDDYVIYFCGLECYEQWHNQTEKNVNAV